MDQAQVESYFAQLTSNPYALGAVRRLEESYEPGGEWQELVGELVRRGVAAEDAEVGARMQFEAARLAATRLGNAQLGGQLVGQAFERGAQTLVAFEAKLLSHAIAQEWDELQEFFAQALEVATEGWQQSVMYTRLGEILEAMVGDEDQAYDMFKYAAELDDENGGAVISASALARKKEDWPELADLLVKEINISEEVEVKLERMLDLGDLYLQLEQVEAAGECYANVYEYDAANPRARAGLEALGVELEPLPAEEAPEEAPAAEAEPEPEPEVAEEVAEEAPAEPVAQEEPADEEPVEEAADDEDVEEAPVAEEAEEAVEEEDVEAPAEEVAEDAPAEDEAVEAEVTEAGEVAEDAPAEEGTEEDAPVEEAVEGEAVEEVAAAEEEAAPVEEEDEEDEAPPTWRERLAQMEEELPGAEDKGAAILRMARKEWINREGSAEAERVWAAAFSEGVAGTLYEQMGYRYDDPGLWSWVLDRAVESGDAALAARVALYKVRDHDRAAELAEGQGLEDVDRVLADKPAALENWRKFQREVEQRYPDMDRDERNVVVFGQMAQMGEAVGDDDKVFDALRRLDRVSDDATIKGRLGLIYRDQEKWPAYVDLLKQEADGLGDDVEGKVDLWRAAITVYREQMRNDMQAIGLYKQILEEDAGNRVALDELIELYASNNRTSEQIALLQEKAELVKGKGAKVALLKEVAGLYLEKFRNQAEAIKAYEAVLELASHDPDALAFLKEMYEKRREWEKLIDVHRREIEALSDEGGKVDALKEVAALATEKLRDPADAIALWREVLEKSPGDDEALSALEGLYEKSRDYEPLAGVIEQRVELVADAGERMKLYQKLGMLCADRLEQPERAMAAWQGALELDASDLKARKSLERLYVDNHKWDELEAFYAGAPGGADYKGLVRLLESQAGGSNPDEAKIELLLRSARVWREHLDDVGRAERSLERIHQQLDARNEAAAAALVPIYEESGDTAKLLGVLEIILGHREGAEPRREIEREIARLHEGALEDPKTAFSWYMRAYEEDPSTLSEAGEMERVAGLVDGWGAVVSTYEKALGSGELEDEVALGLRMMLVRVLSAEQGEHDEALAHLEGVLETRPEHVGALAAMEQIFVHQERWDELMGVYQRRLGLVDTSSDKIEILHGMARIAEEQAGDAGRAVDQYLEAYALDPAHQGTLRELHRLYAAAGSHGDLAQIIREEIALIERVAVERRRQTTSRPRVDTSMLVPALAAEYIDSGVAGPDLSEVSEELDEVGLSESSASDAEEGGEGLSEESSDGIEEGVAPTTSGAPRPLYLEEEIEELVGLHHELGQVAMRHLGAHDEAIMSFGQVMSMRPNHGEALAALEEYFAGDDAAKRPVATILEPVYEVHGRWHDLIATLEVQTTFTEGAERAELRERVADIYLRETGEPERSFEAWGVLFGEEPGHERAQRELATLADALGMWPELIDLYEGALERAAAQSEELAREHLFTLGAMYTERVERYDDAKGAYFRVLEREPGSERALDALEELYTQTDRWAEMIEVYDRKRALYAEDEAKVEELQFKKALVYEQMLGQPGQAAEVLGEILAHDPENMQALGMQGRLFRATERWAELGENLREVLALTEGEEEQRGVLHQLGEVHELNLGEPQAALDIYERVLEEDRYREETMGALERMLEGEAAPARRASELLEPRYVEREQWAELVRALEVRVTASEDPSERVELMHRVIGLYEQQLSDVASAFATACVALHEGVDDERTLGEVYRLSEETMDWGQMVDAFESVAGGEDDPERRRDMLRRAAAVYIEKIGDVEQAAARLREVLEIAPRDLETINDLENIYQHTQDFEPLVGILLLKADVVDDYDDKKQLLYQAGAVYEDVLEQPGDAVTVYESTLEIDPNDAHAIDRLETLYTGLERWDDLQRNYQRKLELTDDPEGRKDLLYVIGGIYQSAMEQPFEAVDTYRAVLDIDPMELAALEKLDELYVQTEQWNELLDTLHREIELTNAPSDRHNLMYRVGRLHEGELTDPLQAVTVYRDVLAEDPAHEATKAALAGMVERGEEALEAAQVLQPIYEAGESWEELIGIKRLLLEPEDDEERRLELLREIARIEEGRLGDTGAAFGTWAEALGVNPARDEVASELERVAAGLGAWDPYIDRLDELMEGTSDASAVAALQKRVAAVYEREIGDAGAAIDRYVRVLENDPVDEDALPALDRLYEQQGRWEDLADVLGTRVEQSMDPDQRRGLMLKRGMVFQTALERYPDALETYRSVLADSPEDPEAIGQLEAMFTEGHEAEEIMGILEPHYLGRVEHDKLVTLFLTRLEQLEDPDERFELLTKVAQLFTIEIGDEPGALQPLGAALIERPGDEEVMRRMEEIAAAHGMWAEAAQAYMTALESPRCEDETSLRMWLALARAIDVELGSPADAEGAYVQALALDPGEPTALAALDRIYTEQARWEELSDILATRARETYEDDEQVDLNFRLACVQRDQLGDLDAAVVRFNQVLAVDPSHMESLKALEQLHMARQEWQPLYDVLNAQSEIVVDPDEQARLLEQMASISEEMLGQREDAIGLLGRVVDLQPDNRRALVGLRTLYMAEERWADVVSAIEREIDLVMDPEERLGLYESLGVIWGERLEDEVQALEAWNNALHIEPRYLPALEALRDLHARRGEYYELSGVLARMLELDELDNDRKRELWIEQADIQGTMLTQPEDAIHAWTNVLTLDPGSALAIENLERLYLQEGHWEQAAQIIDMKLDLVEDQEQRLGVLRQVAELCEEKLMDRARAASYYEQILEIDLTDGPAYDALEQIYQEDTSGESLNALVELYLTRSEILSDQPLERLDVLRAAARLFEEQVEQPESALVVLLGGLVQETAEEDELRDELERLARNTGMWGEVVGRYGEVLGEIGEGQGALALNLAAGRVFSEELGQPDDAVYYYQMALRLDENDETALARLEVLYEQIAAWPELAGVIRRRIELADLPDDKIDLWRKVGGLYESQLAQIDEAVESYFHILAIDEADMGAIDALARIFETYERWDELVDVLRQKAESTYDPEAIVAIKYKVAGVYERELEQPERAVGTYRDILDVDQTHRPSMEALERLYIGAGQWREVLDVYERQLAVALDPGEQVLVYGKVAALQEDQFQDQEAAVDAYVRVLGVQPDNLEAIGNLERLYYELERWFDLVEIVETHVQLAQDVATQTNLLNNLARVHRDQLQDPHPAIDAFTRSLSVDPAQVDVMTELGTLHETTGNWESAVQTYQRQADFAAEAEQGVALYHRVGQILESQLMDDTRAEGAYEGALSIDPLHAPTLEAIEALYARAQDWPNVVRVYRRAYESTKDLSEQARYVAKVGRVYDERMGDMVSALRYYEQAQELDPQVIDSAEPLIDVYMSERKFERALPLLQKVLAVYEGGGVEVETLHKRNLQMAQACAELGFDGEAKEYYYKSYELDPTDLGGLLGLGDQLFKHQEWEAALKIYQSIQLQHVERLTGEQARDVFFRSGQIKKQVGDVRRAIDFFEKALEYDPGHKESLSALVENCEAAGDWERFIDLTLRIAEAEDDEKLKFAYYVRVGDVWQQQLKQVDRAVGSYLQALDIDAGSVAVLRKLLALYTANRQWPEAIDILGRLVEVEPDPSKKAKLTYTMGVISRDNLSDSQSAIGYFDQTLELDVRNWLKAFEAIDRILTDARDWKGLERAYRTMLKRVDPIKEEDAMRPVYILLWRSLGEVYRTRLGHVQSAIAAYKMASDLDPSNEQVHLILAQLYEKQNDPVGMITQHRELIENNALRVESYRALFKAYLEQKEYDKAWCMASALAFLQSANETEQRFYQQYLGKNLAAAKTTFNPDMFRMIYHPDQDMLITVIMQQLQIAFAGSYARTHRDLGVHKRKDLLDPNDSLLFCKIFSYVGARLGSVGLMPLPQLYIKRDQALGFRNANMVPSAMLVGADMFQGKGERELAFVIGKQLAFALPQHYLGSCGYPTEYLRAFFMTAMHITNPALGLDRQLGDSAEGLIQTLADADRASPGLVLQVQKMTKQFLATGSNPNLSRWLTMVDHTTSRVGLVLCGDLHVAAACIKNDTNPVGKASPKDKIKELVSFSISEEYFTLRKQLGLAIGS